MMTSAELLDVIIARLIKGFGGTQRDWRRVVGPIKTYPQDTHAHCNWTIVPRGTPRENTIVENLLDELRLTWPLVV
ncbi:MAG: hypothetical protein EON59_02085 [Alphaproteobacteria bacterium]|nr:MAG: hypothetical protein EON59_02085 [Alphaproteobacteria bacterium]